jgi:hypothetical protein
MLSLMSRHEIRNPISSLMQISIMIAVSHPFLR